MVISYSWIKLNIIGSIDDLIEKNLFIVNQIDNYLTHEFEKLYQNRCCSKVINELNLYISDFVANGSFQTLKENTKILDNESYAYFIRNTDLKINNYEKYVDYNTYEFLKKSKLFGNEILISNVGDVGSVFLAPKLDKPMTLGNNMILVTYENHNDNYYLYFYFKSDYGQFALSGITAGSAQQKFNKTDFKKISIAFPNDNLLKEFNDKAEILMEIYNNYIINNKKLTVLKQKYLNKFFG